MSDRYNGWTNHATWAVALHLDNDEGTYSLSREWAQECWDEAGACSTFSRVENARLTLAERLESFVDEQTDEFFGDSRSSSWAAMLIADLIEDGVNWYEISEHYLDEIDTTEDAADDDEAGAAACT